MKTFAPLLGLLLLIACQSSEKPKEMVETENTKPDFTIEQLLDSLPTLPFPVRLDKTLLADYSGQKINFDLAPKLSSPMEIKEVRALAQIQYFGQKMALLYYAYPTDSEVDDYDQMALVIFDDFGKIATHLPLDIGGTGFASTQNYIKADGEIVTAVIAEMEEVEVDVKTYQFKNGEFVESRQLSKTFRDGSYQDYLQRLIQK